MKTTANTYIYICQLAVVTKACYGGYAFICRGFWYEMKDLAHSLIIPCSSKEWCQSLLLWKSSFTRHS